MPELYKYQSDAVGALLGGKHFCISGTGSGKGSISLYWAKSQNKPRVLVITTASKRDVKDSEGRNDFESEADMWFPGWRKSLSSFETISWAGLVKWTQQNLGRVQDYAIIADEVASMKAGVGSQRGRAFLRIASKTNCWTGYTATPGDQWLDFQAYFVATNKIRNKTQFVREFCQVQTFKGFPEIVGYNHTDTLKSWWGEIADTVDTSEMERQLPKDNHKIIHFKAPTNYKTVLKTRVNPDTDEFMDTTGAVCACLRRMCFTKQKRQWVSDFIENLGDRAILFYNFTKTGDELEEIIRKALPKDAKIWRIDGGSHEIPTADTMGDRDVVIAQWQAGAHGLNLQFINQWVSVEPHYSYSVSVQGRGRVRRIGQDRPQFYWYCLTDNTIESDVYEALHNKSDFAADTWALQNNLIEEK